MDISLSGYCVITPAGINPNRYDSDLIISKKKEIADYNPLDFGWKGMNRFTRSTKLSCIAIGEALKCAKLSTPLNSEIESSKTGIIVGSTYDNLESISKLLDENVKYGPNRINPGIFPFTVLNAIGGYASIYFNITGTNITISNGDSSGPMSLIYAMDLIELGYLERVIICQCNLFPPECYSQSCEISRDYESVISLILEKSNSSSTDSVGIRIDTNNHLDNTSQHDFLQLIGESIKSLKNHGKINLTCSVGEEGKIHAELFHKRGVKNE